MGCHPPAGHGAAEEGGGAMSAKIVSSVPTKAGLYWWRPSKDATWIMVSMRGAPGFPPHAADDVSGNSFYGRPVSGWRFDFPVGEWIEVQPPAPAGSPGSDELRTSGANTTIYQPGATTPDPVETLKQLATLAHYAGLAGRPNTMDTMDEIRRLSLPWFDPRQHSELLMELVARRTSR
jgi:hypothetical protein